MPTPVSRSSSSLVPRNADDFNGRSGSTPGKSGTNTSRSYSSAYFDVMRDPLFTAASTTSVPTDMPAMMRFRSGKLPLLPGSPGSISESRSPLCEMTRRRSAFCCRYRVPMPVPRTATVGHPAFSAPMWHALSVPMAPPLTIRNPARARLPARSDAALRLERRASRAPTMAKGSVVGVRRRKSPNAYRTAGQVGTSRSSQG